MTVILFSLQEDFLQSFTEIPRERLERTYQVNLFAMFSLAQKAVKQFEKQGGGNIINLGSIQAYKPTPGILDYATTKVKLPTRVKRKNKLQGSNQLSLLQLYDYFDAFLNHFFPGTA